MDEVPSIDQAKVAEMQAVLDAQKQAIVQLTERLALAEQGAGATDRAENFKKEKKKGIFARLLQAAHERPKLAALMTTLGIVGGGLFAVATVPGLAPVGQVILEIGRQFGATLAGIGAGISRIFNGTPSERAAATIKQVTGSALDATGTGVKLATSVVGTPAIGTAVDFAAQSLKTTINSGITGPNLDQIQTMANQVKQFLPGK